METTLIDWLHQLGTLEFWEALLEGFEGLGPLVPILLAMVESIFPPLPLIAIVALNIAAHGGFLGFVYSWLGVAAGGTVVFLFWRRVVKRFFWKLASRSEQLKKAQQWVSHVDTATLFMLAVLPFTPTSFLHLAFGISDFDEKRYLLTLLAGKAVLLAYRIDGVQHSLLLGRSLRSDRCSRCAGRSAQHRDCRRTDQQRRKEFFRQFHVPSLHEQIFCPALRRALCVVYHRQKSAVNAQIRQKCR